MCCACVKEDACGGAACASVRSEMRDDLKRDKYVLVGCLLGRTKNFSLHLPFSICFFFLFYLVDYVLVFFYFLEW